jgi:adenylylsulfate kinase
MVLNKNNNFPIVLWFSGLSGSGKTTIALALKDELVRNYFQKVIVLDGDELRSGINKNLSFSNEDRSEANRRAAELAKFFFNENFIVIVSTIAPFESDRKLAKKIINSDERFKIVSISASLKTCMQRDPKGLYSLVEQGKIPNFTGYDSSYENPNNPDILIDTESQDIKKCVKILIDKII